MGAWGSGHFENDDARDFLDSLHADTCAATLNGLFDRVISLGMQGGEIDATEAAQTMAAAELIAAARGHASNDFPPDATDLAEALQPRAGLLLEKTCGAVSYVLMNSELVMLWAESDEIESWNRSASDLITRLDLPARAAKLPNKSKDEVTGCVCVFCGEQIRTLELVTLDIRRPWEKQAITRTIFAHEGCLNAKAHPKHLVQWWTPPES